MDASQTTDEVELTIIVPPGQRPGFGVGEMWRYRSVGFALTRRNLMVRYRQTALGVAWVVIQPLVLMIVFSIFFSLIARFNDLGVPFPVFYICALWLWTPIVKVLTEGVTSVIQNEQMVTRIYVPRAMIPFSVAAATLVDLIFDFAAFQFVLLLFGITPDWKIIFAPILVAIGYVTALGMSYLSAAVNTRYRDAQLALPFLIQIWFFISPVIYPAEWVPPDLQPLYYLNPMALVITGSRWAFADMAAPPGYAWPLGIVVAVACLVGGYLYFRGREPYFADEL